MRIAITGGIAEGKSTILQLLSEAGQSTLSADALAREVFTSEPVQSALRTLLGIEGAVSPEQARAALPKQRRAFNRLMHGAIWDRIACSDATFVEIPLLLEAGLHPFFDRIWVVTCGEEEQLKRLIERLGDPLLAERLLGTQLPTPVKIAFADVVVRTDRQREAVQAFVQEALRRTFSEKFP